MKSPHLVPLVLAIFLGIVGSISGVTSASANGCINPAAGTISDPYLIQTPANLSCLVNNDSYYWGAGKYFKQTADLDMAQYPWTTGIGTAGFTFEGSFDGQGFSISNLAITSSSGDSLGLFGKVGSATVISDVHLTNASVTVTGSGIAQRVGLLVGFSPGTVEDSSAEGTISITRAGNVHEVGGLVGNSNYGNIDRSTSDVDITITTTNPGVSNNAYIGHTGGLVGFHEGQPLTQSSATGSINLTSYMWIENIGGFAGSIASANVSNSYTTSSVSVSAQSGLSGIGGFAGKIRGATIEKSFTASTLTRSTASGGQNYIGGFVGQLDSMQSSTVRNTTWNSETTGLTGTGFGSNTSGNTITSVVGITTVQNKTFSTFGGTTLLSSAWDIYNGFESTPVKIWGICGGSSFPFLRTETITNPCPVASVNLSSGNVLAGGTLTLSGTGYQSNENIRIELHSNPVILATVQANGSGSFSTSVVIPSNTSAGSHNIVVYALGSSTSTTTIIVVEAALANTGYEQMPLILIATLLLLSGSVLVMRRKSI